LVNEAFAFYQKGEDDPHHFDQPFAYLSSKGFLDYIHVYSQREVDTTHIEVEDKRDLLHLFFNCKADSVKDAISKTIRTDQIELSLYQNLFDNFGIPPEM